MLVEPERGRQNGVGKTAAQARSRLRRVQYPGLDPGALRRCTFDRRNTADAYLRPTPRSTSLLLDVPERDVGGDQHAQDIPAERGGLQVLAEVDVRGVLGGAHRHGFRDGLLLGGVRLL